MEKKEKTRNDKDLEVDIEAETICESLTLDEQKADFENVSYAGPTLSLDFSLVAGVSF